MTDIHIAFLAGVFCGLPFWVGLACFVVFVRFVIERLVGLDVDGPPYIID